MPRRCSYILLLVVYLLIMLSSILMIASGIWLSKQGVAECSSFLRRPVIIWGVILLSVSLAGLIYLLCSRPSWCLSACLLGSSLVMILVIFGVMIFAFSVINKGAGEPLPGKGYMEYRLGDYSSWLRKRVKDNWPRYSSCIQDLQICRPLVEQRGSITEEQFSGQRLSALQSGCCKPSNDCHFTYVSPTNWTNSGTAQTTNNTDCKAWSNDQNVLCYNCQSCMAGMIDNSKRDRKKVAILNIVVLSFLIIVHSVGCCVNKNNTQWTIHGRVNP